MEKDKKSLHGYPDDKQEGAGRDSQYDERPEMIIVRLPAQWAFFWFIRKVSAKEEEAGRKKE